MQLGPLFDPDPWTQVAVMFWNPLRLFSLPQLCRCQPSLSLVGWGACNPPFACFSRMMAAWASFVRWNSVPDWLFFFFCASGSQYRFPTTESLVQVAKMAPVRDLQASMQHGVGVRDWSPA